MVCFYISANFFFFNKLYCFLKGWGHSDRKVFAKHLLQFICLYIYKLLVWEITLQSRSQKRKSCREGGGNNLKYISLCFLRDVIQFSVVHIEIWVDGLCTLDWSYWSKLQNFLDFYPCKNLIYEPKSNCLTPPSIEVIIKIIIFGYLSCC